MVQTYQQCPVEERGALCSSPTSCHFRHARAGAPDFICFPCDRRCCSEHNLVAHLSGAAHSAQMNHLSAAARRAQAPASRASPAGSSTPPLLEPERSRTEFCPECQLAFHNVSQSEEHYAGRRHEARVRVLVAKRVEESAKHGVELLPAGTVDFGTLEIGEDEDRSVEKKIELFVRSSPKSPCFITGVRVRSSDGAVSHGYTYTYPADRQIAPASTASAGSVTFRPLGNAGHYTTDTLVFTFALSPSNKTFTISRSLSGIAVESISDVLRFKPTPPFARKTPGPRAGANVVRPPKMPKPPMLVPRPGGKPLGYWKIPKRIREPFGTGRRIKDQIEDAKRLRIVPTLSPQTYVQRSHALLWIQELNAEQELAQYDLEDATLTKRGDDYFLEVPGLVEKRPAVFIGDIINVQRNGTTKFIAGKVTSVSDTEVGLRFSVALDASATYLCQFNLTRIVQRRMHEALDGFQARITFPQPLPAPRTSPATPLFPRSRDIMSDLVRNNRRQKKAVRAIFNKTHGSAPFILFGPPGTGKTETIAEAVRQLVMNDPDSRILICAPSNSACDVVATRLADLGAGKLFRLYAPFRPPASVPPALRSFTLRSQDMYQASPTAQFRAFRVVVVTCASGNLQSLHEIDRGHFSHIFIDECGQAEEPEAGIPLAMADERTSIILCGDPKQLGPIVQSPVALHFGLGESLLERLMKLSMYDPSNAAAAGTTVVKLVDNYRSHPKILEFPNREFYGGELRPSATDTTTDAVRNWKVWPKREFPIIFHSIRGGAAREGASPSFFNGMEVTEVARYAKKLLQFPGIDAKDIGIISPYNAQCKKLRKEIRNPAVTVGSVEEFQGQERKVIIVSTVRSTLEWIKFDARSNLGFLSHPKRFNVTVTRAQAGLIIVGDPAVLELDDLWCRFLVFIHANGGWRGTPWDASRFENAGYVPSQARQQSVDDLVNATEGLSLADEDPRSDRAARLAWASRD